MTDELEPVEDPPVEDPPVEDPPVEDQPVGDELVEEPVVEAQPVEGQPVEGPKAEDQPVEEPVVEAQPMEEPGAELTQTPLTLRSKLERLFRRVEPLIPWLSLALSIGGAVAIDRHESRGPWVAAGAAAGWAVLVLVTVAQRALEAPNAGALHKVARFAADAATQSIMHLSLFFCAPFYFEASAWTLPQCLFGVLFAAVTLTTMWDPLCSRVVSHSLGGPLIMAFASFVGWNAALPMVGIANRTAVLASALGVGLAIPITRYMQGARGKMLRGAILAGILLPTFLLLGGIRAIPPAPLRVVQAGIGTQVVERELIDARSYFAHAPEALFCFTAIRAPLGLKEELAHVWSHNGKVIARIPLNLRGGRRQGFRTWSRVRPSERAEGTFRCDVLTSLGQSLGFVQVKVGE